MLRHAFQFLDSVVLLVNESNVRSQRSVEKIGGVVQPGRDTQGRLVYRIAASTHT